MLTLSKMLGLVRRAQVPDYGEGEPGQMIGINHRGSVIINQDLPERSELVRQGNSWGAAIPTGSAFTFVAAWPTTRAELVIFNQESANGKTYLLDRVWMANISSEGAAQPSTILGQLVPNTPPLTAPADNAAVLRWNLAGTKTNYNGKAALALASTAFAVANKWVALGYGDMSPMTTNLGAACEAFLYGRHFVPPGACYCLAGLAGTAAGTAILGAEWHEVQTILAN